MLLCIKVKRRYGDHMSNLSLLLGALSHPIRLRVLEIIEERGRCTFTELMKACNLNLESQCGVLDYHLKRLMTAGLLSYDERGGYKLTESGVKVIKALKDSLLNDLTFGIDIDEGDIIVEELKEDNLKVVEAEIKRIFSEKVPRRLFELELSNLKKLVSENKVRVRERVVSGVIERHGTGEFKCSSEEELLTFVVFYKNKLIGIICGLVYETKFSVIKSLNYDRYSILGPTEFFKVYDIMSFWLSNKYNRAKVLNAIISKISELSKKRSIAWVVWRVPEHYKEVSEYLRRKGYYNLTLIYSNAITSFGLGALDSYAGIGMAPISLIEIWRVKIKGELSWMTTHHERVGGILTLAKFADNA